MNVQVPLGPYRARSTYQRRIGKQPRLERQSERFNMKTSPEFLARLDQWRREQSDLPNRSEAIRRLVEIAISTSGNAGGRCESSITVQP